MNYHAGLNSSVYIIHHLTLVPVFILLLIFVIFRLSFLSLRPFPQRFKLLRRSTIRMPPPRWVLNSSVKYV